jgi:nucleoid DNA-binding protein
MAKASKPAKKTVKKAMTKSALVAHLADKAGITKKQADTVLATLVDTIVDQVSPKSAGKFVLPGICRVTVSRKDAVKGGEKKINRLTGAEYITKDKPAYNQVKLRPVKSLKDALK